MRIGAINRPARDLVAEIQWVVNNGFDFVDLRLEAPGAALETTNWATVAGLLQDHQLDAVCQAATYLPIDNPSPVVRQSVLDEIRRTVDVAQRLRAPLCSVGFLGWPAHLSDEQGYAYYQQFFEIVLKHGQERGVQIALENGTQNRHQMKYFREIFHRLPQLQLTFNVAHLNIGAVRSTSRDFMFALADRLALVHMSDNDGQTAAHLPFGAATEGGIQLEKEIQTLQSFGFDGNISLELFGDRQWLLASAHILRSHWRQQG